MRGPAAPLHCSRRGGLRQRCQQVRHGAVVCMCVFGWLCVANLPIPIRFSITVLVSMYHPHPLTLWWLHTQSVPYLFTLVNTQVKGGGRPELAQGLLSLYAALSCSLTVLVSLLLPSAC
jgi:hypothetical protein